MLSPKYFRKFQRMIYYGIRMVEREINMKRVLLLYYSNTGNTKKVALAIKQALEKEGLTITVKGITEDLDVEFYDYDFICFGTPVIHSFLPPVVHRFVKKCERRYRLDEEVFIAAPQLIRKNALIFVTYSGPHCGINEAIPTGKYMHQFFQHLGFRVAGEWYEIGEFHGWEQGSKIGRLGDIRGRPNHDDLQRIKKQTKILVTQLKK